MIRLTSVITILLVATIVAGCATQSPSLHEEPAGRSVVYELSVEDAQRIVHSVMSSHFAGSQVDPLGPPKIGFTTYTRFIVSTWTTTVTITPVTASFAGRQFQAVRIETAGSGGQVITGRPKYESFKERLRTELDSTGSMRVVEGDSVR